MRIAALLAISVFLAPGLCHSQSAKKPPLIEIQGPNVIAFFAPVTDAEMDKDADLNETLSDFQLYARQAREPLNQLGIDFHQVYAHSFQLRVNGKTRKFRVGKNCGYYFVMPGKKPLIHYGVDTDDDIVATARGYFGMTPASH